MRSEPGGRAGTDAGRLIPRAELPPLGRLLRAARRGAGAGLVITGPPGSGKGSVVRAWDAEARREGGVLPLLVRVPSGGCGLAEFAAEALAGLAARCLATRTGSLEEEPGAPLETTLGPLRGSWPEAAEVLGEAARRMAGLPGGSSPVVELARVPDRLSRRTGMPVLCLCENLDRLADLGPAGLAVWCPEAARSSRAPVVFTAAEGAPLERLLGPAASALRRVRLGPLPPEAADQLARLFAGVHGLALDEEARGAAVTLSGGWPGYLRAIVDAVRQGPGTGVLDVARAYGASVAEGALAGRWLSRLAAALPRRPARGVALEILAWCLREGIEPPEAGRLPALIFRPEADVEEALAGLERAGVVRIDCRLVRLGPDPVLRDVVRALHRREFGGAAPDAVAAAATAEAVDALHADAGRRALERFRRGLRAVLEAWDGRAVPAALFDAAALGPRPHGVLPEELAEMGRGDGPRVNVPRIVSTAAGRIGFSTSPVGLEMDAVAWGWRGELGEPGGQVIWAVRRVPAGPGMAGALQEFDRAVAALQAAGDLPAARVVRWAVLGGDPDPAAAAAAAELRIATSTFPALRALAGLVGVTAPIPDPGRPAAPADVEVEMTIPARADAELVAARALEQLAELTPLGADDVRRVRTALVEACINAFEHSGCPETRVRLVFTVARDELRIRVENRGRSLAAAAARLGEGEGRRRGWGLRLMRELMDRVELEAREDGVTLLMAKRLGGEG